MKISNDQIAPKEDHYKIVISSDYSKNDLVLSNDINISSLPKKKENFSIYEKFQHFFLGIFRNGKSSKYLDKKGESPKNKILRNVDPSKKPVRTLIEFVKLVIMVLRSIKEFRWRTKFRSLKFISVRQILFINDLAFISEEGAKSNKFNFIKFKFIRVKLISFKKKFKTLNNILRNY